MSNGKVDKMSKANQPRKYLRLISRASSMISAFEPSVMIPVRKLSAMSIANQASDINLNFAFVRKLTKNLKPYRMIIAVLASLWKPLSVGRSELNSKIGNAINIGMSIILSSNTTRVVISQTKRKFEYGWMTNRPVRSIRSFSFWTALTEPNLLTSRFDTSIPAIDCARDARKLRRWSRPLSIVSSLSWSKQKWKCRTKVNYLYLILMMILSFPTFSIATIAPFLSCDCRYNHQSGTVLRCGSRGPTSLCGVSFVQVSKSNFVFKTRRLTNLTCSRIFENARVEEKSFR